MKSFHGLAACMAWTTARVDLMRVCFNRTRNFFHSDAKRCLNLPMKITVEIEDDVFSDLMEITGDKNKSPAVVRAVTEFVRRTQAREFGRMIRDGFF